MIFLRLIDSDRGIVRVNPAHIQMYYRSEGATLTQVVLTDGSKSLSVKETQYEIDRLLEGAEK